MYSLADTGKRLEELGVQDLELLLSLYESVGLPRSLPADELLFGYVKGRLEGAGWCRLRPDEAFDDALYLKTLVFPKGLYVHSYILPSHLSEGEAHHLQESFEDRVREAYHTEPPIVRLAER